MVEIHEVGEGWEHPCELSARRSSMTEPNTLKTVPKRPSHRMKWSPKACTAAWMHLMDAAPVTSSRRPFQHRHSALLQGREGYHWPSWKTTLFLPSQWNIPVNGLFNYFQTDMPTQYSITLAISLWKQRWYFASNTSCQSSTLIPFSGVKSAKWRHSLCSKKRTKQIELKCVRFRNHQCAVNSFIGMKPEWHFQSWISTKHIYMCEVQPYVTSNKLCWLWEKTSYFIL